PGGSISWKLYDNSKCEGEALASDGPVSVTANGSYETTKSAAPSATGTYYWVASYSGDSNNKAIASGCADEPISVGPASPAIETTQKPSSGTVGDTLKDPAYPTRPSSDLPGGSISWKLYDNSKCEGEALASDGPVSVTANGSY